MDKEFINPTVKEFITFLEQCDPKAVMCTSRFDCNLEICRDTLGYVHESIAEYIDDDGNTVEGKIVCITAC